MSRTFGLALLSVVFAFGQRPGPDRVAALEKEVAAQPGSVQARSELVRHYSFQQPPVPKEALDRKRVHLLWLIRNQPDAEILGEPGIAPDPEGPLQDPETYREALSAWKQKLAKPDLPSRALMRAASFLQITDRTLAYFAVERGIRQFPNEKYFLQIKGSLDVLEVAGVKGIARYGVFRLDPGLAQSPSARRAAEELEKSTQLQLLTGAFHYLPQLYTSALYSNLSATLPPTLLNLAERLAGNLRRTDVSNPTPATALSQMYFAAASRVVEPAERLPLLEKSYGAAVTGQQKFYVIGDIADAALSLGQTERAGQLAREWLSIAENFPNDWNYGNAIHRGNLILGRIALAQGNLDEAEQRLLAAGRTKGSPQLNSFGPRWELAQELLNRDRRTVVLDYMALCRNFWKGHEEILDNWQSAIRAGAVPHLGNILQHTMVAGNSSSLAPGATLPDFRLPDLTGKQVSLHDFKGSVVLLDFWATWCPPCRAEMPAFEKLQHEWKRKGISLLAVDVDEPKETVADFLREGNYTFPVLLTEGTNTVAKYGLSAYPTLVVADKSGRVVEVVTGGRSEDDLRAIAERALTTPAPAPAFTTTTAPAQTADEYFRLAVGFMRQRNLMEGEKAFTQALQLRKDWVQALSARAQARYELKRFDDSIADLNEVIRLRPTQASAYDHRGLASSYSGHHDKAVPDYTKAIELAPDNANPYNNRGWAFLELGKPEQALPDLNRALEINPAYQLALENRLRLYMQTKQYALAIGDAEAVLRLNPAASWARDRIAEARRLMGATPGGTPLAAPELVSPEEGAIFDQFPRHTKLIWQNVDGAVAYEVEIDFQSGGKWNSEINNTAMPRVRVTQPEYRFEFVGAQLGRWRVRAMAPDGTPGQFSRWGHFSYTH